MVLVLEPLQLHLNLLGCFGGYALLELLRGELGEQIKSAVVEVAGDDDATEALRPRKLLLLQVCTCVTAYVLPGNLLRPPDGLHLLGRRTGRRAGGEEKQKKHDKEEEEQKQEGGRGGKEGESRMERGRK